MNSDAPQMLTVTVHCSLSTVIVGAMNLTLAEAAIGAGAVLEAPASVRQCRRARRLRLLHRLAHRRLPATCSLPCAASVSTAMTLSPPLSTAAPSAAVVSRARVAALPDAVLAAPLLIAEDPLLALQSLAAHVRRQWGRRVVAITGSAGKTTTKEAVAAALAAKFSVLKSQGNLNNAFGLPLQLLRLEPEHEFAVVEMGMNHAGEIAALARIAAPDWGVVTNVGTAHIENFADGQAGIARAKFELVAALPANGVAFLNCDDPYVSQFGRDFPGRVVYFGDGPCADPQILAVSEDLAGLHVHFRAGDREGATSLCSLLGAHNASNAMAGLAVALEAGVDLDAAVAALAIPHRRRQARTGHRDRRRNHSQRQLQLQPRGAPLHDSHPGRAPRRGPPHPGGRRDARAGRARPRAPRRLWPRRRRGRRSTWSPASRATPSTWPPPPAPAESPRSFFPMPKPPAAGSSQNLRPGDVVLVKGSRGVHLERAIEALKNQSKSVVNQ